MKQISECRLSGQLYIIALELLSLFLQHSDAQLQEKWQELSDHAQAIIRRCMASFYHKRED